MRFCVQLTPAKLGDDHVQCEDCNSVFWTGNFGWWCPKCGADTDRLTPLTELCERCLGQNVSTRPEDPWNMWLECVECGHMQRRDCMPFPFRAKKDTTIAHLRKLRTHG